MIVFCLVDCLFSPVLCDSTPHYVGRLVGRLVGWSVGVVCRGRTRFGFFEILYGHHIGLMQFDPVGWSGAHTFKMSKMAHSDVFFRSYQLACLTTLIFIVVRFIRKITFILKFLISKERSLAKTD